MIQPFDVILTWKRGNFISEIISFFTRKGPSHVRTWIKGLYKDFDFFEVTFPEPRFGYIRELDLKKYRIEVGRHKNLPCPVPDEMVRIAIDEMIRLTEKTKYDVGELWENLLEELGIDSVDNSNPEHFVCSSGDEHNRKMWKEFEKLYGVLTWCPEQQLVSPQDIRESDYYIKLGRKERKEVKKLCRYRAS